MRQDAPGRREGVKTMHGSREAQKRGEKAKCGDCAAYSEKRAARGEQGCGHKIFNAGCLREEGKP